MIIVNFPAGITDITIPALNQWDYNQRLAIYGLDLPPTVQVHFCTKACEEATVRLAYKQVDGHSEVDIPNRLLQDKYDIRAFIFINSYEVALDAGSTSEGPYYVRSGAEPNYSYTPVTLPGDYVSGTTYYKQCGKTTRKIAIPIDARLQPAEYVDPGDPTQEELMAELVAYCNTIGARVGEMSALIDQYRTFSDIRIMTRDEFNALETKEGGVIYVFSDDTTLEEIEDEFNKIEEMLDNLGFIEGSATVSLDIVDITQNNIKRQGNYCILNLDIENHKIDRELSGVIATLPENFRPKETFTTYIACDNDITNSTFNALGAAECTISTDGTITVYSYYGPSTEPGKLRIERVYLQNIGYEANPIE